MWADAGLPAAPPIINNIHILAGNYTFNGENPCEAAADCKINPSASQPCVYLKVHVRVCVWKAHFDLQGELTLTPQLL